MAGNSQNPTTMWTPSGGFQTPQWQQSSFGKSTPTANPWGITNPNYTPDNGQSQTIQDPTATGKPSIVGPNASGTTGVLNPFGLTEQSNWQPFNKYTPGVGGAPAAQTPTPTPMPSAQVMGQEDPVSKARRDAQYAQSGATQNANGGWTPQGYHLNAEGILEADGTPAANTTTPPPNGNGTALQSPDKSISRWGDGTSFQTNSGGNKTPYTGDPANTQTAVDPFVNGGNSGATYNNGSSNYMGIQTGNQGGTPPPTGGQGTQGQFQTDVTSSSLDNNGNMQYSPTNPNQFATSGTAGNLAKQYGLNQWGLNLQGPGNGFSSDMQMLGNGMNAGLMQGNLNRYGNGPTSYGNFMNQRDIAQQGGQGFNDNYNAWATSQPGFKANPNLANNGPASSATSSYNPETHSMLGPGQQGVAQGGQQGQFGQQSYQGGNQGYQGYQQGQQGNMNNNIYSQLAQIMPFLQMFGMGGGQQQQQQYQRPPQLSLGGTQGLFGFPYYSKFA